jgi:hypothetical protein
MVFAFQLKCFFIKNKEIVSLCGFLELHTFRRKERYQLKVWRK